MKKKFLSLVVCIAMMLTLAPQVIFAAENEEDSTTITEVVVIPVDEDGSNAAVEPRTGRFYKETVEIVADRKTNEYVYEWGMTSASALRRAYVYSEKHYQEIERKIGNDYYRRVVRDVYDTTWKGQTRVTTSSAWKDHPSYPKKHEISYGQSPLLELLEMLM